MPDVDLDSPRAVLGMDAERLSAHMRIQKKKIFPTTGEKTLRKFGSSEAAALLGVGESHLRQLTIDGQGPAPEIGKGGRRAYSLGQINELREFFAKKRNDPSFVRHRRRGEKLQVLSIANFKGGCGKTTTAAHLAQYLALQGYRVLAIDLDAQASLTTLYGIQPEIDVGPDESLYGAIRFEDPRAMKDVIRKTYFDGLDVIPANIELTEFEHDTPLDIRRNGGDGFFSRVGNSIAEVDSLYDVVVIDCPPHLGFLTMSALCASNGLIITVHPQMIDVASMSQFLMMLHDLLDVALGKNDSENLENVRYLVTRYEPTDGPQTQMAAFLRSMFEGRVLTSPMLKSTAIADAGITKQTLYELGREWFTRSTYDRAKEAMDAVNREIEGLLKSSWGRP